MEITSIFGDLQDKRIQILAAAAKIFADKGFHQAKVEEIAMEAGVGKGTVYEYFSSKLDLFQQTLRHMIESYQRFFESSIDSSQSVREQLFNIMDLHLHFLAANESLTRFGLEPHPPLGGEMSRWLIAKKTEILDGLAEILETGIKWGELRPMDTFIAAQIVFGAMVSLSGEVFLGKKDWNFYEVIDETLDILFNGLGE